MYPLVAPAAQYIPPTSSFFYLLYEISVLSPRRASALRDLLADLWRSPGTSSRRGLEECEPAARAK